MILREDQIKSIILENPNRDYVAKGRRYNKLLRMHLYGEGLKDNLDKIDGYETKELADLKVKYARSNKDVFARLKRPIDKVFSARGGSIYFNLAESLEKKVRQLAFDVRGGRSIRKWVELFWTPHLLDDPYGLVFLEILPESDAVIAKSFGRSFVYPTYKSISSIFDYQVTDTHVDYVVFKVENSEKIASGMKEGDEIYRVIDDAYDYWVKKENNDTTILKGHSYKNYFGFVPALLNSNIPDPCCENGVLSFFDDVMELAKHFLMKGAIKLTHEFMHAYPKYWQYAEGCSSCNGTGYDVKQEDGKCKECRGTGKKIHLKVSDAMLLDMPSSNQEPIVTPNIAGYVSPDKTYYEIATADIKLLEELMTTTVWGAQPKGISEGLSVTKMQEKTATEVMNDVKPQSDRLQVVSEMAEKVHKFILDAVIRLNMSLPNYQGSSVSYGRRYMIESPDEIWKKYAEAKKDKAPVTVLEDLLIEYYEAKYSSDPIALAVALKLMYVEPFIHRDDESVELSQSIKPEDKARKIYFNEWLSTVSNMFIISSDVDQLKKDLEGFTSGKIVLPPPPETKQIAV